MPGRERMRNKRNKASRERRSKDPRKKMAGAPSLYNEAEHPAAARMIMGNGKTFCDLAQHIGVAIDTVNEWRKVHPLFSAACDLGKEDATNLVERALFERAVGYEHKSEKIVVVSNRPGGSSVERVPIKVHYPPDAVSMQFWLKNRKPQDWREKSEVDVSMNFAVILAAARKRAREGTATDPESKEHVSEI